VGAGFAHAASSMAAINSTENNMVKRFIFLSF
jgi:hypothetical protein